MRIRMDALSFTYPSGVRALEDIDLAIESGEIVAIVGENGAGKSTLVKQLNGLLRPSAGSVQIGDWDASEHSTAQLAQRVGFLFQNPDEQLFERTVWREVAFGPRNLGLAPEEVEAQVWAALERVGLAAMAESHPYDLPHTQRKLIALAATLAMNTPIIVLDEPTVGQDALQQAAIAALLADLQAKGCTLILITHDLDFCAEVAERVVVMAGGRILADGPTEEVLTRAALLNKAAVEAPQIVRLAQALEMPSAPLTIPGFVEEYADWKTTKDARK